MKRISAIIPVYNGEATVARAIDSALTQRFDGTLEVVAVNDGSTDSTGAVLNGYGSRIKVITQTNRGPARARNVGVAASSGEYLAFLDADDYWLPGFLARLSDALEDSPHAVLAFSRVNTVDGAGRHLAGGPLDRPPGMNDMLQGHWVPSDAVIIRRSAFDRCGGFCEEFRGLGYEDSYLWILAREQGEFVHVPEPLVTCVRASFPVQAVKYGSGLPVFARLMRRRYGKAARKVIDDFRSYFAPGLVQMALLQVDTGDLGGAAHTLSVLLRTKPSHLFKRDLLVRLLRRRNARRLARALRGCAFRQTEPNLQARAR
jgi:glycosyltransferase involved in cell wall biosynthesis